MRPGRFLAGIAALVALLPGGARADEPATPVVALARGRGSPRAMEGRGTRSPGAGEEAPTGRPAYHGARSIGTPSDGHLEHGRRLRESDALRYLADAAPRGRIFGTEELLEVLERGSQAVAHAFPGSVLRVGDLSARGGGEVHMHASHESGRDADVAFYLRTASGEDALPPRFVVIGPEGKSADGAIVFDDARNWALVASLLANRRAVVSNIFVAEHVEQRLLAFARANGADPRVVARAETILSQPRGSFPHDNHFHVRVACAADDKPECIEGTRRARR